MRADRRLILFLCALIVPTMAWATIGMMQEGYGVKSRGMAGIGIARPQDAFAVAQNPSGIVQLCDRFDIGLQWVRQDGQFRFVATAPVDTSSQLVFHSKRRMSSHLLWPEAGIVRHLGKCWAWGVAFYAFGGWDVHFKEPNAFFDGTVVPIGSPPSASGDPLSCSFQAYFFTPAIAWRIHPMHSLGLAVNIASAYFRARGLERFSLLTVSGGNVTNRGLEYTVGASVRIGWLAQPLPCLGFGITYQTPTWMGKLRHYRGLLPHGGEVRLPSQIGAGVTWRLHPLLVGSIDVLKVFWRDGALFRNTSGDVGPFGSASGPGFGWRGQMAFKFGLSWEIVERLTVRAGYCHQNTPMFPSDTFLNILAMETIKDTITIGATWSCRCNEFSLSYMRGLGHHITGDTNVLLGEGSFVVPVRLRSRQDAFGFSYGRRF